MKWFAAASLFGGLLLATVLVAHFGAGQVAAAIGDAGWAGVLAISLYHLVMIGLMGVGWWLLARGQRAGLKPWTFIWGRLLRDAGSEVLPLSQVGGYVLGARVVILRGVRAGLAAGSTVVDVTMELCGQIVFTAVGVALLLHLQPGTDLAPPVLAGLGLALVAAVGFLIVQRRKLNLLDRIGRHISAGWLAAIAAGADAVQDDIRAIYRDRLGVAGSFSLHLFAWFASAVEVWLALHFIGAEIGFGAILAIESLVYAARSVAFLVPNALGVQEGAYVLLGGAFGLTPEVALALSLLKRARDIALGVPALLLWQAMEGRRLWVRRTPRPVIAGELVRPQGERGTP